MDLKQLAEWVEARICDPASKAIPATIMNVTLPKKSLTCCGEWCRSKAKT